MIDSGASHHMTDISACLSDLRDIKSCPVGLPNGQQIVALKERTAYLGRELKLQCIFSRPNMTCILICVKTS